MHKNRIILYLFLFLLFLYGKDLYAFGLGAYVDYGVGRYLIKYENDLDIEMLMLGRGNEQTMTTAGSGGFIFSTRPYSPSVFDYRLKVGIGYGGMLKKNSVTYFQINSIHSFAFKLYRNDNFKIWIGPQLMINYIEGKESYTRRYLAALVVNIAMTFSPDKFQVKSIKHVYKSIGLHLGGSLGLNYNMSKSMTLTCEAGIRIGQYFNTAKREDTGDLAGFEGFMSFAVLRRLKLY